jgi:hypothetical protein
MAPKLGVLNLAERPISPLGRVVWWREIRLLVRIWFWPWLVYLERD